MNRTFDTDVQLLKYKVLKAVSKRAFDGTLTQGYYDIPKEIIPGKKATMRCCVYKERAILAERVHMAMGGNPDNPNVIEVIDIACDECPVHKVSVTESCRGCIAHRCQNVCPRGAITIVDHRANIDQVRLLRAVRPGLPLRGHSGAGPALRAELQGGGHLHEPGPDGGDR